MKANKAMIEAALAVFNKPSEGGNIEELFENAIQAALDTISTPEPFGYFKAEPFGWTDCNKDDEGAIALYEAPPTREPLSESDLGIFIGEFLMTEKPLKNLNRFARRIEQAHEIGVK